MRIVLTIYQVIIDNKLMTAISTTVTAIIDAIIGYFSVCGCGIALAGRMQSS
jgi:hypothetical protein